MDNRQKNNKNRRIEIRISDRQKAEIEQIASMNNISVSELITKAIVLYMDMSTRSAS